MGNSACARTHFDVLGDFAFSFLQGHSKYISMEKMS